MLPPHTLLRFFDFLICFDVISHRLADYRDIDYLLYFAFMAGCFLSFRSH